jgi:hypothetical protein
MGQGAALPVAQLTIHAVAVHFLQAVVAAALAPVAMELPVQMAWS